MTSTVIAFVCVPMREESHVPSCCAMESHDRRRMLLRTISYYYYDNTILEEEETVFPLSFDHTPAVRGYVFGGRVDGIKPISRGLGSFSVLSNVAVVLYTLPDCIPPSRVNDDDVPRES